MIGLMTTLVLTGCGGDDSGSDPVTDVNTPENEHSNETSLACFNPISQIPGTTIDLEYKSTGLDYDVHEVVEEGTEYNGFSNVLIKREGSSLLYVQHDENDQAVVTLGQIDHDEGMKIDYQPSGLKLNYNLEHGETKNYPTVTVIDTSDGDTTSYTMDTSLKYLGRETITVPAGRFETCVFEHKIDIVDEGVNTNTLFTRYTGVDNGVVIKEITETMSSSGDILYNDTTLLETANINGEAIQGL